MIKCIKETRYIIQQHGTIQRKFVENFMPKENNRFFVYDFMREHNFLGIQIENTEKI